MTELRKGQKVRVTFDTIYDAFQPTERCFRVWLEDEGKWLALPRNAILEPIEDLRPGDVYRARGGRAYVYVGEHPRFDHEWIFLSAGPDFSLWRTGTPIPDKDVARPLTLLVRDGQAVTS